MRNCGSCRGALVRVRRTFLQRFAYHAVFFCKSCGRSESLDQWYLFLFGRTSRCPRCGSFKVEKLRGVDHIDPMYKNPLSYFQKYFGAAVHWCPFCRLQFYDLRKKGPSAKRTAPVAAPSPDMAESGE
jgi:hypothetical protein